MLDKFTMRPALLLRMRGSNFCVSATVEEKVGLEDFVEQIHRHIDCRVLRPGAGKWAGGDSGVVYQDVEPAVFRFEVVVRSLMAGRIGHIELQKVRVDARVAEQLGACSP